MWNVSFECQNSDLATEKWQFSEGHQECQTTSFARSKWQSGLMTLKIPNCEIAQLLLIYAPNYLKLPNKPNKIYQATK